MLMMLASRMPMEDEGNDAVRAGWKLPGSPRGGGTRAREHSSRRAVPCDDDSEEKEEEEEGERGRGAFSRS
ncbi:hypothetical protein EYF80_063952 [Liparis tanakae]|uniref:Uncharacterized protein n=1 Tax=Liparis tanakae TaxID=230148 RepID=A0A4Z2EC81_9TELE|nr:hypothetical protein EYF80_063952 [Liparis tanakae]